MQRNFQPRSFEKTPEEIKRQEQFDRLDKTYRSPPPQQTSNNTITIRTVRSNKVHHIEPEDVDLLKQEIEILRQLQEIKIEKEDSQSFLGKNRLRSKPNID